MTLNSKALLIILLALNFVVLLGQVWPQSAPPFARIVNIIFLVLSFVYFVAAFRTSRSK